MYNDTIFREMPHPFGALIFAALPVCVNSCEWPNFLVRNRELPETHVGLNPQPSTWPIKWADSSGASQSPKYRPIMALFTEKITSFPKFQS